MRGRFTRTSSRPIVAEEFGVTNFVNIDLLAEALPLVFQGCRQRLCSSEKFR